MHWYISSVKDPRWNREGYYAGGAAGASLEMRGIIEKLKKELGDPPDDLEMSAIKG